MLILVRLHHEVQTACKIVAAEPNLVCTAAQTRHQAFNALVQPCHSPPHAVANVTAAACRACLFIIAAAGLAIPFDLSFTANSRAMMRSGSTVGRLLVYCRGRALNGKQVAQGPDCIYLYLVAVSASRQGSCSQHRETSGRCLLPCLAGS